MSTHKFSDIALSAQLVELGSTAPSEIKLLPAGCFRAKDGRPANLPGWVMDDRSASALLGAMQRQADASVIDYEHQTLNALSNGKPAPAAGWYAELDWRPGDGLYAVGVEWTPAARQMIENREYRYISPVISYDKTTGAVTGLPMAALVNYPALDGLNDLAAAHFNFFYTDKTMDKDDLITAICYLLNLPLTSTAEEIGGELDKVKALIGSGDGLRAFLTAQAGEVAALAGNPDPTQFVPLAALIEMQAQLAALSSQVSGAEIERLIADNPAKLPTPGMQAWARDLSVVQLRSYLDTAVAVVALKGMQSGGKAPLDDGPDTVALSAAEMEVAAALGVPHEAFLAHKLKMAGN